MRIFTKYYTSIHTCTILAYEKLLRTNKPQSLIHRRGLITRKGDALKAYRSLMGEFVDAYGISREYEQYLNDMANAVHTLALSYHSDKAMRALGKIMLANAMQMESANDTDFSEIRALVSKGMGFLIPDDLPISQFFAMQKSLTKEG